MCSSLIPSYCCLVCRTTKPALGGAVEEPVLHLKACKSLSVALRKRLLGGKVTRFCESCNSNQECIEQSSFSHLPDILILRIRRDQFVKGEGGCRLGRIVECDRHLTISLQDGDKISSTTYHLIAVSHHLPKGHYTTTLIDPRCKEKFTWKYNDESVSKTRYDTIQGMTDVFHWCKKILYLTHLRFHLCICF